MRGLRVAGVLLVVLWTGAVSAAAADPTLVSAAPDLVGCHGGEHFTLAGANLLQVKYLYLSKNGTTNYAAVAFTLGTDAVLYGVMPDVCAGYGWGGVLAAPSSLDVMMCTAAVETTPGMPCATRYANVIRAWDNAPAVVLSDVSGNSLVLLQTVWSGGISALALALGLLAAIFGVSLRWR